MSMSFQSFQLSEAHSLINLKPKGIKFLEFLHVDSNLSMVLIHFTFSSLECLQCVTSFFSPDIMCCCQNISDNLFFPLVNHVLCQHRFKKNFSFFLFPVFKSLLVLLNCVFSSVQSLGCVRLFATPCITARQASLSITNSRSSPKLMSVEFVMPSSHLILCRPLLLLPPTPPSIRVFPNESTLRMRWPTYWSFSFSISPSNEHPGLISFRMDWLDLLAVQGTLKSLL